jgi:hypothetical protein
MRSILASTLLAAATAAWKLDDVYNLVDTVGEKVEFIDYLATHGKFYSTMDEYKIRFENFK